MVEKSTSEVAEDEDGGQGPLLQYVTAVGVLYAAITFNSGRTEVDDEVPVQKPQQPAARRKTAEMTYRTFTTKERRGHWCTNSWQLATGQWRTRG